MVSATIPRGRMRGDADGDGAFTVNDYNLINDGIGGQGDVPEKGTEDWYARDTDGNGIVQSGDALDVLRLMSGLTKAGRVPEITGTWTVNPNYETEAAQFYYDLPVEGITAGSCSADIIVAEQSANNIFDHATILDGYIRIWVRLVPSAATPCNIQWYPGNGTATISNTYAPNLNAMIPTVVGIPIRKNTWNNGEASVTASYIDKNTAGFLFIKPGATVQQIAAVKAAQISIIQDAGALTFIADGTVPTIEIPLQLLYFPTTFDTNVAGGIVNLLPQGT